MWTFHKNYKTLLKIYCNDFKNILKTFSVMKYINLKSTSIQNFKYQTWLIIIITLWIMSIWNLQKLHASNGSVKKLLFDDESILFHNIRNIVSLHSNILPISVLLFQLKLLFKCYKFFINYTIYNLTVTL